LDGEMIGLPHVMSYLHLLGTGHLYNYLKSWGYLKDKVWKFFISSHEVKNLERGAVEKFGPMHSTG
jgi:hypothetical protein